MVSAVKNAKPTARRSICASARPPRADSSKTPAASAAMPIQLVILKRSPTKTRLAAAVISGAEPRAIG
jgi:hypothetical protein